jgi:6-phosphogluconolactonase (cycloisomerase 2 family)
MARQCPPVRRQPDWLPAAGRFASTTNAGSGSIGGFAVAPDGSLSHISTIALGTGSHPLDEAVSRGQHFLYVLVDGFHQINGYRVGANGSLTQVTSVSVPAGAIGAGAN